MSIFVQVTSELFYETVLHYSEGKISLFELFDDIIPPAAGGGKPGKANLGTVSVVYNYRHF